MIALRIIVFYPLMLYKYVYVFVNTAIKQMQNGYGIDSAWYRWKSILFFITSAFEVISSRIFARESFFECSRSFLISLECIQLYGSTVRESRSIPLERIRNPRNCSIQILNWNMVENGIGWKRATEPILILSSTKYNAIILWWHVTSQRVSGQKFDVDDEGQGGWARPLSRLLSLFLFFFFLFFTKQQVNCMQPTTIIPDRYVNPMSSQRDEYCYMLVAAYYPSPVIYGEIT